jgi:hypothetical protein
MINDRDWGPGNPVWEDIKGEQRMITGDYGYDSGDGCYLVWRHINSEVDHVCWKLKDHKLPHECGECGNLTDGENIHEVHSYGPNNWLCAK